MRHRFNNRQRVSFGVITSEGVARKQLVSLGRSDAGKMPPVSSVTLEQIVSGNDEASQATMLSAILPAARFFGCQDLQLTQLAQDVSQCGQGDLAVYRIGEGDPNDLISEVMARGASGILTEQLLPCPLPQCVVGSIDHAMAKIASVENQAPDRKLLTVGVLGHSGKTSTVLLAATLTKAIGIRTAYQCDLGSSDGVVNETPSRDVPVGADLIHWIGESSDCLSRVAIIEIDEKSARDGHYDALQFDVLMVTGKRELSDDFGPSGLHCLLERLTSTGIVIAPEDDTRSIRLLQEADCQYVTYGTTSGSEFGAIMIDQSGGMSTLMLSAGDASVMMETPLVGMGMAGNLAATAALGSIMGHSLHDIAKHLTTLRSIPGRGQRLIDFGQATVVIETGGSIDRVSNALRTAKATGSGGRVWCVLSVGDNQCEETLASFGQTIERHAHHCVVTSQPNQSGSFLKRSHQILDGVKECAAIRLVADQNKAIEWALETSRPRDTVVVITNRCDQTAHQARTEFNAIAALVEATRSTLVETSNVQASNHASDEGTPVTLKLFP